VQAERGPGEPAGVAGPPGDLGRIEAGPPAAGQVAGPAAGGGQLAEQLGPPAGVGRGRPSRVSTARAQWRAASSWASRRVASAAARAA
jgi:hypothetical protein